MGLRNNPPAVARLGYSRREVAEAFGVSHEMIIGMTKRGQLPTFMLGCKVMVPAAALDLLIKKSMRNFRPEPVMARLVGLTDDPRDIARRRRPA